MAICPRACLPWSVPGPRPDPRRGRRARFALNASLAFDAEGNLITTLHEAENRTIIPLARIPQHVQDAVIAIEDERFYEHEGVDVRAILRALLANAQSGEIREGGSTITQQLVKNLIISPGEIADRTLDRKITEAALSRQLEKRLTKKEILESYLNTVYFGNGAYGVQAAAADGVWAIYLRSVMFAGIALLAAFVYCAYFAITHKGVGPGWQAPPDARIAAALLMLNPHDGGVAEVQRRLA